MKEIEIGGAKRPVKYNINSLIEFEELTGVEISQGISGQQLSRLKNTRALVFVGLKHGFLETSKEPLPFTIEDVGKWFSFGDGSVEKFLATFTDQSSSGEEIDPNAEAKK